MNFMLSRALAASALLGAAAAAAPADRGARCGAACQAEDDAGSLLMFREVGSDAGAEAGADFGSDFGEMDPGLWKYPKEMLNVSMILDDHNAGCSTVFLTTVLGTRGDPVHSGSKTPPDLVYFLRLYRSVLELPGGSAKVIFLHDFLPDDMVKQYTTADGSATFVKVDISRFDPLTSVNDLRYYLFEEQIQQHPEWDTVFMTDASDVTVVHNPCALVERFPEKAFVQSQGAAFKDDVVHGEMTKLGGDYMKWYEAQPADPDLRYLNAGIQGGKRDVMLKALKHLNAVFRDPNLAKRQQGRYFDSNMAAVNYVYRRYFPKDDVITGYPLHSKWLRHENRTDVYLKHK